MGISSLTVVNYIVDAQSLKLSNTFKDGSFNYQVLSIINVILLLSLLPEQLY